MTRIFLEKNILSIGNNGSLDSALYNSKRDLRKKEKGMNLEEELGEEQGSRM